MLGIYYLTRDRPGAKGEGRVFASLEEVLLALDATEVTTQTPIKLRIQGDLIDLDAGARSAGHPARQRFRTMSVALSTRQLVA